MKHTAEILKEYLDHIGFNGIFKYLSGLNNYYLNPYRINWSSEVKEDVLDDIIDRDGHFWGLLKVLTLAVDVPRDSLTQREREVAEALIEEELLAIKDDSIVSAGYQLISYGSHYLFIDARINYPRLGSHDVYIGIDTYLMLYYLETENITPSTRCIDLCTGSGISALYMSRFSDNVVGTRHR